MIATDGHVPPGEIVELMNALEDVLIERNAPVDTVISALATMLTHACVQAKYPRELMRQLGDTMGRTVGMLLDMRAAEAAAAAAAAAPEGPSA